MPATTPFIHREFELHGRPLPVHLHAPAATPHGDFECRWEILWPQGARSAHAVGMDSMQALLLALVAVRAELIASPAYQDGKLTYLGGADLGFPPASGKGCVYLPQDTD